MGSKVLNENTKILKNLESREYKMAYKSGFLMKKSKSFYRSWSQCFYVLTNIGLIYMTNPNDKEVKLFPYIDFEIEKVADLVFMLTTPRGK